MFDHIGFLVTKEEHDDICSRAEFLGWNVNAGDRRTFIGTPIRIRIELQQREDVSEKGTEYISSMSTSVKDLKEVKDFSVLFGKNIPELHFTQGKQLALSNVTINGEINGLVTDPNGVNIRFVDIN